MAQVKVFVVVGKTPSGTVRRTCRTDAEELDLSGMALEEVPADLLFCNRLRYLDLSNNRIKQLQWLPPTIRRLVLRGNLLRSLEGLPLAAEVVDASDNCIAGLERLPPLLRSLDLCGNGLELRPATLLALPALLLRLYACCNPQLCSPQQLDAALPRYLTHLTADDAAAVVLQVNSGQRLFRSLRDDALRNAARDAARNAPPAE